MARTPRIAVHVTMLTLLCSILHLTWPHAGLELACHAWHGASVICGCMGGQLLSVDAGGHTALLHTVPQPHALEHAGCEGAAAGQREAERPVAGSQAIAPPFAGELPPALCEAAEQAAPAEADAPVGSDLSQPGGSNRGLLPAPAASAGLAWLAEADPAAVACVVVAEGLLVAACTRQRGTVLWCGAQAEAYTCYPEACMLGITNAASPYCQSLPDESNLSPHHCRPATARASQTMLTTLQERACKHACAQWAYRGVV